MDPDHFINCLRVYDGTDPIQIDLFRRQSKAPHPVPGFTVMISSFSGH